jgi:hypothetical protein
MPRTPVLVGNLVSKVNLALSTMDLPQFSSHAPDHFNNYDIANASEDADFQKLNNLLLEVKKPKCEFRSRKLS